ncbi:hypothetical protein GCM10010271_65080 [Streptomyces kurssanovii]|nr:hypothetical protein GCM10010271_65080 [Streptomyces kurssanovii]
MSAEWSQINFLRLEPLQLRALEPKEVPTDTGVRLPDLTELRARGTLGVRPTTSAGPRRGLGRGAEDAESLR